MRGRVECFIRLFFFHLEYLTPCTEYRGSEATKLRRTLFEVSFPAKRLELDLIRARKIRRASSRFVRYECVPLVGLEREFLVSRLKSEQFHIENKMFRSGKTHKTKLLVVEHSLSNSSALGLTDRDEIPPMMVRRHYQCSYQCCSHLLQHLDMPFYGLHSQRL